jgi:hypothetical protein
MIQTNGVLIVGCTWASEYLVILTLLTAPVTRDRVVNHNLNPQIYKLFI